MILIALQNADQKYEKTRHNVGAILLSEIESSGYLPEAKFFYNDTFMNLSGEFVKKVFKKENIQNNAEALEKVYVFFDDMNIPVGKVIISRGVGASSHNGIKSILNSGIQNEFYRVRVGVGQISDNKNEKVKKVEGEDMSDFVLSRLSELEIAIIKPKAFEVVDKIMNILPKS